MSLWLLLMYGVAGVLAQNCTDYEPEVTIVTAPNYVSQNITLHCSAAAPDALSVEWTMAEAGSSTPRHVYRENLTSPDGGFIYPDFEGNVTGKHLGSDPLLNHSLILHRVGPGFNDSTWQCNVKTVQCPTGNLSAAANLQLKTPFLHDPVLKDSEGRVLDDGSELEVGSEIFCEAESDPASELSFTGAALEDVGEAVCEEQDGGGWLCSSHATFSSSGEVQCVARQPQLQTERCAGGDTCVLIYIQIYEVYIGAGIIFAICFTILGIVAMVVGGIVYYKRLESQRKK